MDAASLQTKLTYARRQKAYAWAKYYEQVNAALADAHDHHARYERVADDREVPAHIKTELKEMATTLKKKWECPICVEMIDAGDLEITNCGHFFCKECLKNNKDFQRGQGKPKWECAVCRRKHAYGDE